MDPERALELLRSTGALLEGHFLLTSGNHSNRYVQCALLLSQPQVASCFTEDIAAYFRDWDLDIVAAPAMGGIIVAYEVSRLLGKKGIFLEREGGAMSLRRGFSINRGERVLIVEDVITTGSSVLEVRDVIEKNGGLVKGFASIVNRSGGRFKPDEPYYACVEMDVPIFSADQCPFCKEGIPVVKPGSRGLK